MIPAAFSAGPKVPPLRLSKQEIRINRRLRSVEGHRSESRRNETDNQKGDDNRKPQQNFCTDLILYREFQDVRPPGVDMSENPLMRLPISPISLPYEALAGSRRGSTTGPVRHQPKYLSRYDIIPKREQEFASEQVPTDPQEQTDHLLLSHRRPKISSISPSLLHLEGTPRIPATMGLPVSEELNLKIAVRFDRRSRTQGSQVAPRDPRQPASM